MNAGEGKSINKASKRKTATRKGPKQGLKSVDFARLFDVLSHSKTVGRGFKSYCPCHAENPHESLILAGFCFFIFREQRSTKSHFDAQIGHQFPICSVLFVTFPSVTSSKEHQKSLWWNRIRYMKIVLTINSTPKWLTERVWWIICEKYTVKKQL